MSTLLSNLLARLHPREAQIVALRHGLVDGRPRKLKEVAAMFGMGVAHVSLIDCEARRKMRLLVRLSRLAADARALPG